MPLLGQRDPIIDGVRDLIIITVLTAVVILAFILIFVSASY